MVFKSDDISQFIKDFYIYNNEYVRIIASSFQIEDSGVRWN